MKSLFSECAPTHKGLLFGSTLEATIFLLIIKGEQYPLKRFQTHFPAVLHKHALVIFFYCRQLSLIQTVKPLKSD